MRRISHRHGTTWIDWIRSPLAWLVMLALLFSLTSCSGENFLLKSEEEEVVVSSVVDEVQEDSAGLPAVTTGTPNPKMISDSDADRAFGIDGILAGPRAFGAEPFCLQLADADGDGQMEWIGLRELHAKDSAGISGFVLDGDRLYPLGRPRGYDSEDPAAGITIGERPICDLTVEDINLDDVLEIVARGQARDGSQQLAIFTWDGTDSYPLLASFGGSAGVRLTDDNGDGMQDIVVENDVSPGIILEEISLWNGSRYVRARGQYAIPDGYLGPLSLDTAELTLIAFYLQLDQRNLTTAYQFLSPALQERQEYRDFVLSVAAVKRFRLGELEEVVNEENLTILKGSLITEVASGAPTERQEFYGEWQLKQLAAGWHIAGISLTAK